MDISKHICQGEDIPSRVASYLDGQLDFACN